MCRLVYHSLCELVGARIASNLICWRVGALRVLQLRFGVHGTLSVDSYSMSALQSLHFIIFPLHFHACRCMSGLDSRPATLLTPPLLLLLLLYFAIQSPLRVVLRLSWVHCGPRRNDGATCRGRAGAAWRRPRLRVGYDLHADTLLKLLIRAEQIFIYIYYIYLFIYIYMYIFICIYIYIYLYIYIYKYNIFYIYKKNIYIYLLFLSLSIYIYLYIYIYLINYIYIYLFN